MTKTYFWLYFLTLSGLIFSARNANAQTYQPSDRTPVADNTQIGTKVSSGDGKNFDITGGLNRGQTLFHSFQDFSVPTNGAANFANPAGIRDIISRVTGGSFSDINGRINSNGANFFLINPNGIVFGPNAQLNVGRAFMASTANGINLVDAGGRAITFGTNPNGDAPLLTISPNVFFNVSSLTLGGGNGQINNFGKLQTTNPSQYIRLIGGNVSMIGGEIIAPGGNVELAAVSGAVTLTDGAFVSVAGSDGGGVAVNAQNLNVLNGSEIAAGISDNAPNSQAGDIDINIVGNIEVGGNSPSFIYNEVFKDAVGNSGKINIQTDSLRVTGGSLISSSTQGVGDAGNLTVRASKSIILDGDIPITEAAGAPGGLLAQVDRRTGKGRGGDLTVSTKQLSISNGSKIQAASFAQGSGGNILIQADEINLFNNPNTGAFFPTGINAGASLDIRLQDPRPTGNGGTLTIETGRLSLRNPDNASNRILIGADTDGVGNAGQMVIRARDLVEIAGSRSLITASVGSGANGSAGGIKLDTPRLIIRDRGKLTANSSGSGNAGNLSVVNGKTIELRDGGVISTETLSGQGGNIDLNVSDYLLMRQNSQISTSAGTAQLGGDGGNIDIRSPFVIALPGNSDITANAYTGKGGNIAIKSNGLFGIKYRPVGSDFTNDITASSTFGQIGKVNVITPGIDPGKDSTTLPNVPTDASNQIAQTCSASNRQNKFTVAGRGGMPPNANEPLTSDVVWQDPRATNSQPAANNTTNNPPKYPPPAVGLVFDGKGKAMLVAAATEGQPTGTNVTCPQAREQFRIRDQAREDFRIRD